MDDEDDTGTAENEDAKNSPPEEPTVDTHAECKGLIHGLSERVDGLEDALKAVVQFKPDSTPVKRPWTHRGSWK